MHRVFDFSPADPDVIVSRILVQVHQAVDDNFPHARPASQRFAKTAFVGSDEPTLTQLIPSETLREAMQAEDAAEYKAAKARGREALEPQSAEEELAPQTPWWRFGDNTPLKQTLIGIRTLILIALLAYVLYPLLNGG